MVSPRLPNYLLPATDSSEYFVIAAKSQRSTPISRLFGFLIQPEEARRQINQWFESATAGRIKDFLPQGSVHSGTPAVLGNALYFKGAWWSKFYARFTQHDTFYLPNGGLVRAPFMSSSESQYIACRPESRLQGPEADERARPRSPAVFHVHLHPELAPRPAKPAAQAGLQPGAARKLHYSVGQGSRGRLQVKIPKFTTSYKMNAYCY